MTATWRELFVNTMIAVAIGVCLTGLMIFVASAHDPRQPQGHHGIGHDQWHEAFYSKLRKKDGTSCCNLNDCMPTQSRMIDDRYEVLVEGVWTPVPKDVIKNITAPDGGAHVCAPKQWGASKGVLYCVVLPPEG